MNGHGIRLVLYQQQEGAVPLLAWLDGLPAKARAKCHVRLERLRELGHALRRPEADYLRDGIYELRAKHDGINYRILYFFFARGTAVVSHGIIKQEASVPRKEIALASRRKRLFKESPEGHSYRETF